MADDKETAEDRLGASTLLYEYVQKQYDFLVDSFRQVDSRIQNRLTFIAFLIAVVSPSFSGLKDMAQQLDPPCLFPILLTFLALFWVGVIVSVFYALVLLEIDAHMPTVKADGIRALVENPSSSQSEILLSLTQNYLNAHHNNNSHQKTREIRGNRLQYANYFAFACFVLYIVLYAVSSLFFAKEAAT